MKTFRIEKYINDVFDEKLTIPVAFINILTAILPTTAIESLVHSGFNFSDIIEASKRGDEYHASVMIRENGITKRIEIYL